MEEEDTYSDTHGRANAKVSLRDFDDVDPSGFMNVNIKDDEFDDIDDLEKQIDFDAPLETDDKFKNELLFYVQGLGSTKKHNELEFYMKGPHCEDSLKDIIRMCKRDDDDFPGTKIELGKWEVLQKDLLQLLVSQHQDKKLTFYLLILIVQLTEHPRKSCARRNELLGYLQSYKLAFSVNNNVIQTINMHLADCFSIAEEERTKTCEQMIELIVTLYKNLLKVPDYTAADGSVNQRSGLQPKLITALHKQDTLDAFIFMVQQSSEALMKRLNLNLLEIFYCIFSAFEPQWLFQRTDQDKGLIQTIREREQRERMKRLSEMSTRHARFDCNIKVVRNYGGGAKIIHNPFKTNTDQNVPNTLKKPKSRKFDERNSSIFPNNHNKEVIISNIVEEAELHGSLKHIIRDYAVDFVEHAYDKLIESLYEEVYKNSSRIEENDKIYYFVIMAFGLEVFRLNFYFRKASQDKSTSSDEYNIASVGAALQLTVFELIQSTIMKEVTTVKKKSFSVRTFHAAFHAFLQLLYCIKEMRISMSQTARKSAQILMQKIFTQDNAKMLRLGFNHYQPDKHDPKLGRTLTEFVGTFLDLLDEYSRGKVLKIQTNRKIMKTNLKEKKRAKREREKLKKQKEKERLKEKQRKEKEKAKKKKLKEKEKEKKRKAKLERAKPKKQKVKKHKKEVTGEEQEEFIEEVEYREEGENENENVHGEEAEKRVDENEEENHVEKEDRESAENENENDEEQPRETLEDQPRTIRETINPTVGTEYTVGSQESNFMQTLENIGSTLETEATIPQTLDNATLEVEFQEPAPRVDRRTPQGTIEIENTLPIEDNDDQGEAEGKKNNENLEDEEDFEVEYVDQLVKGQGQSQSQKSRRLTKRKRSEDEEDEEGNPTLESQEKGEIIAEKPKEDSDKGEEEEEAVETDGEDDDKDDKDDSDDEDKEDKDEIEVEDKKSESEKEEEDKEELEDEGLEDDDDDDDEDSDDESDGGPEFQERIVNFASELAFLADYKVLDILLNMIRADKLESNDIKVNNAVAGFMKKIITVLKADWLFFQIDYLLIFQDILNLKNPRLRVENQPLFEVITSIVRGFFALMRKNKMLSVECLFRFANRLVKDAVLNNYQEPEAARNGNEDDDIENFNGETDGLTQKRGHLLWDEKSDLLLMQNYDDYKDLEDCDVQLCLLFTKMNLTEFSAKDIKKRIKTLKLEKGREKAQEMFDLIYKDVVRLTLEQALKQALPLVDVTKFTKEDLIEYLINILEEYINFKRHYEESAESPQNTDMAIVPLQKKDFDILEWDECIDPIFRGMNLREPKQGENYWRVPGFLSINEVQTTIDRIKAAVEAPTETIGIYN